MYTHLPPPELTLPIDWNKPVGMKLIRPVSLEGYHRGYSCLIQDEYEAGTDAWYFVRRVKTWSRPLHYDYNGKTYRCTECEAYYDTEPSRVDEVLMIATWTSAGVGVVLAPPLGASPVRILP